MIKFWGILTILFYIGHLNGQVCQKTVTASIAYQIVDSLSIIPGSVYCLQHDDTLIPRRDYTIDYINKTIAFSKEISGLVSIRYSRINFDLSPKLSPFDSLLQRSEQKDPFSIPSENNGVNLFEGSALNKRGSISRGLTFGNQQNLGINSTLNLELTGQLSDNINILASISDANIPVQPDGNTNKLQEFDQVYIQVYNQRFKLIAGDFWINRPPGYFLNYKKRGQGLSYTQSILLKNNKSLTLQSSAGLSKGKFNRQIIQGVENNQGPYRLVGAENEPFIVVLSGTERVYIDGKLLARGQEFDYTIDYNNAELVFTSRNLITKDVRIVVEFQYSDQYYTRGLAQQHISYTTKKTSLWLNLYQEQDMKNQPLQLSITESMKASIGSVGDSLANAFINTIDSVGFQANQNLYRLIDTLGYDSVLVFSVHPDSAKYRATFLFVGANKGNYILEKTTAFGKVFKWVNPIGGVPQGGFEPVQRVIAPKRKRFVAAGIKQALSPNWSLETELTASESAINLYSSKDRKNDWGWGNRFVLSRSSSARQRKWTNQTQLESEYLNQNFSWIEPFRAVEFDRDWNVRNLTVNGNQRLTSLSHKTQHTQYGFVNFKGQQYKIGSAFLGYRLFSDGSISKAGLKAIWDGSLLSSGGQKESLFLRHRLDLSYAKKRIQIGIKDDQEYNKRDLLIGQNSTSYAFYDVQGYIQNADTNKTRLRLFYRERFDWRPDSALSFKSAARGTTLGGEVQFLDKKGNASGFVLGLRKLIPLDTTLLSLSPDQSLVGRINTSRRMLHGALIFDTYYEIGSGLEQKRNFIYIEVNAGQGIYTWIDYNQDGVKDLNEFETAAFVDQANYIRVFTPSNEYQKIFTSEYNQSLFWKPEIIWGKKMGVLKGLSIISDQLRIRSNRKIGIWDGNELLNPFNTVLSNPQLITSSYSFRNTLFLFRTSAKVNINYTLSKSLNKMILASGYDAKGQSFHELLVRWNILPSLSVKTEGQIGQKTSLVDYTQGRNYDLDYQSGMTEWSLQPNTHYRVTLQGKLSKKHNILGNEASLSRTLGSSFKYNTSQKGSFQGEITYHNILFSGNAISPVAFEMLESLRPGSNFTWNATWQRSVGKNLQLNLVYSGRKTMDGKVVHNGGMELRAFF